MCGGKDCFLMRAIRGANREPVVDVEMQEKPSQVEDGDKAGGSVDPSVDAEPPKVEDGDKADEYANPSAGPSKVENDAKAGDSADPPADPANVEDGEAGGAAKPPTDPANVEDGEAGGAAKPSAGLSNVEDGGAANPPADIVPEISISASSPLHNAEPIVPVPPDPRFLYPPRARPGRRGSQSSAKFIVIDEHYRRRHLQLQDLQLQPTVDELFVLTCLKRFCLPYVVCILLMFSALLISSTRSEYLENERISVSDYTNSKFKFNLKRAICIAEANVSASNCLNRNRNETRFLNQRNMREICTEALNDVFYEKFCLLDRIDELINAPRVDNIPLIKGEALYKYLVEISYVINFKRIKLKYMTCVRAFEKNPFADVKIIRDNSRNSTEIFRYDFIYKNYGLMRKCSLVEPDLSLKTFCRDPKNVNYVLAFSCGVSFAVLCVINFLRYTLCAKICEYMKNLANESDSPADSPDHDVSPEDQAVQNVMDRIV